MVRLPFRLICINTSFKLPQTFASPAQALRVGQRRTLQDRLLVRETTEDGWSKLRCQVVKEKRQAQFRLAECWHDLLGDALELLEHHGLRRAQAGAQIDVLHAWKARLKLFEMFDELL
jgi:hypothetical protein